MTTEPIGFLSGPEPVVKQYRTDGVPARPEGGEGECWAVTFRGSRNPDSPSFGPDEYCGEPTEDGRDRCAKHAEEE